MPIFILLLHSIDDERLIVPPLPFFVANNYNCSSRHFFLFFAGGEGVVQTFFGVALVIASCYCGIGR